MTSIQTQNRIKRFVVNIMYRWISLSISFIILIQRFNYVFLTWWVLNLKNSLNLWSLLNSMNLLSVESSETARKMHDCISTLLNIWLICFCRFLMLVSSAIIIWDKCIFKIHDLHCSWCNIFYLKTSCIFWYDVYLHI